MTVSLPSRSTRGKRLAQTVEEDDVEADEEFWKQEFFAEEHVDYDYVSEAEQEDVFDSDFNDSEDEDDDEDDSQGDRKERRKVLRPPGYVPKAKAAPPPRKPRPQVGLEPKPQEEEEEEEEGGEDDSEGEQPQEEESTAAAAAATGPAAPRLRRSTVFRSEESQKERQRQQQQPRRRHWTGSAAVWRPMSQEELLLEAARTEVENAQSLQQLLAMEEETKRQANAGKRVYDGPRIRMRSAAAEDNEERTTLDLVNMPYLPPWLIPQYAPQPVSNPAGLENPSYSAAARRRRLCTPPPAHLVDDAPSAYDTTDVYGNDPTTSSYGTEYSREDDDVDRRGTPYGRGGRGRRRAAASLNIGSALQLYGTNGGNDDDSAGDDGGRRRRARAASGGGGISDGEHASCSGMGGEAATINNNIGSDTHRPRTQRPRPVPHQQRRGSPSLGLAGRELPGSPDPYPPPGRPDHGDLAPLGPEMMALVVDLYQHMRQGGGSGSGELPAAPPYRGDSWTGNAPAAGLSWA